MASDCGDLSLIPATAWRGCVKHISKRLSQTQWLIQASACRHSVADTKSLVCARPKGLGRKSSYLAGNRNMFFGPKAQHWDQQGHSALKEKKK